MEGGGPLEQKGGAADPPGPEGEGEAAPPPGPARQEYGLLPGSGCPSPRVSQHQEQQCLQKQAQVTIRMTP